MLSFSQTRRKLIAGIAVLSGSLLLAACDVQMPTAGGNSGQKVDTSRSVKVALLVPQAGPGSSLGGDLERAARLAVNDVSGAKLDLSVHNTGGTLDGAMSAANAALAGGAKIIVGPLFAENASAVGRVAKPKNVNVLAFSNNAAIAGGNLFILGNTFSNTANRLVRHARNQGKGRIFIVHSQDTAEVIGRDAISQAISNNGATLAGTASFPPSQQGIIDAVPGIARSIRSSGATSVFLTSSTDGALPFVAELLPENGIDTDVYQVIGLGRLDIPSSALSLTGLQGAWFALPDRARTAGFASRYQAAYGRRPDPLAGLAYDAISAVGALVATGDSGALTRNSLLRGQGFSGVTGPFRFRGDGSNERGLAIAQIQNNQVIVIDPSPRSFGGAGF